MRQIITIDKEFNSDYEALQGALSYIKDLREGKQTYENLIFAVSNVYAISLQISETFVFANYEYKDKHISLRNTAIEILTMGTMDNNNYDLAKESALIWEQDFCSNFNPFNFS
jgi:hypothetical protein